MAKQNIVWSVVPHGRIDGRWRVSIVVSPRLTPGSAAEQHLGPFPEWLDWPRTVQDITFALRIGGASVGLEPLPADPALAPDSALWRHLFPKTVFVSGYVFRDFSRVNLRSYPLRNVLGFVRQHYQSLSLQAGAGEHPRLLPWRSADPTLKGMLAELGTRTQKIPLGDRALELPLPGFDRFHERPKRGDGPRPHEAAVNRAVFGPGSCFKGQVEWPREPGHKGDNASFPLRALPADWQDPARIRDGSIPVANPTERERRAQLMERFSGPAEYAMWQADRFYQRTVPTRDQLAMRRPGFENMTPAPETPKWDFHQRVASYGDHPQLLRRLGLVIDCVLKDGAAIDKALAAAVPAGGLMQLEITSPGQYHDVAGDRFPRTAWHATKDRFLPRPRSEDHADGLLRLWQANDSHLPASQDKEPSAFDVYQLDPDGAALKTVDFLLSAQRLVGKHLELGADGKVTYTTGDHQPVAALRAGGIGISRHGRAPQLATQAAAAAQNNGALQSTDAAANVVLYAEDMLRGYRVDIHDASDGRWRSLQQRVCAYSALATPLEDAREVPLPPDEGYVKGASTSGDAATPDDQYLHETLFRWSGWSLAAPRPGRTLRSRTEPGTQLQTEEIVEADDAPRLDPDKGNGLAVTVHAAKGSLPRLRYGNTYRVRARLVDVAGNSLDLDERSLGEFEQASDPLTYGRFDPVEPPALVLASRITEGESLERLVLRSDLDTGTEGYRARIGAELSEFYANPDFEYTATAERHVVPPKSSQQTCELHGMFDQAVGSGDPARVKKAYAIAARESGSLLHPHPGAQIELVTPQRAAAVATVQGTGETIAPPEAGDPARDRFAAGQYLVHREAIVPVPYLSDPASAGIALHGVPGIEQLVAGKALQPLAPGLSGVIAAPGMRAAWLPASKSWVLLVDFDRDIGDDPGQHLANDWPDDVRSLRLCLVEQPGEVDSPPCGDAHTTAAAPQWDLDAGLLTLFLPKGHIARLRYASFVHDRLVGHFGLPNWQSGDARQQLRAQALAGANWMLTPWRDLVLVHATQHPVCPPRLEYLGVQREAGAPAATLIARRVTLHGPSTGQFEVVGQWQEWIDDPAAELPKRVEHEAVLAEIRLHDNHANVFTLQGAVAEQRDFEPVGGQVNDNDLAKRPAVPGNRHEFGDTRFRFVRYFLRATTRFREYLPSELFADAARITHDGPVAEPQRVRIDTAPGLDAAEDAGAPVQNVASGGTGGAVVPASAMPDAPEIVYVVPTFRWERNGTAGGSLGSTRHGNGLRVYLERPWFSSGDGELLGVVIAGNDSTFASITPQQLPFVTQWGLDPLWDAPLPHPRSRVGDFAAAVANEAVTLPGSGLQAHVVGHRVHFDPGRKLWFCDIELDPGATYLPFVRLALVRYQPHAMPDARISNVVLAEYAQVLPRRTASLSRNGQALSLALRGPVPARGPMRRHNPPGTSESEYFGISFTGPFVPGENGRNRIELVWQTRDAKIDSDLAWEDQAVLATSLTGTDAVNASTQAAPVATTDPLVRPAPPQVQVNLRNGAALRFDRAEVRTVLDTGVRPGTGATTRPPVADIGDITVIDPGVIFDPPFWRASATLPTLPRGKVGRLMLREFERYYTDRTVPVAGAPARRRIVVEERLVYAEVFEV
ncbi:MAG: hypothetical protein J7507_10185 [Pseudoxanthomonas sp.]|nr:hypothetical protein [Pseudoxanthomonas sp.]